METSNFVLALSKTLPESCLQGLAVYLVLQFYFLVDKKSTPLLRFNLYYVANLCLFAGFIFTFFHHYEQSLVASFTPNLLPNNTVNNISAAAAKPGLWLQFNFWINHYAYLITGLYLLGWLFCMLKLTIGIINISWFRKNKHLKLDDQLTQISTRLSTNFKLLKTVSVFISDQVFVPLTMGFIKPIIVLPIALINHLSAEQTEAILLHELAHIKRNDYLLNMLLCVVQSFLFFNPAIWLMKREINNYREQCCDDLVLNNTQHQLAYARALLLIETTRNTQLSLTLASNGKKYNLLNRIKRITNMKTNQPSPQNKFVVLLLVLIVLGLSVAWNLPVKKVVKHFTNRQLAGFNLIVTKNNKPTLSWSADKITVVHSQSNTSHVKIVSDKIKFQPYNNAREKFTLTGNNMILDFNADTTIKSKNKFKIVLEDSLGNKKEYNSIAELPKDAQQEFLNKNAMWKNLKDFNFPDSSKFAFINKLYSSPEWKKQMEDIRIQSEDIRKQFNSPEWKKQMEDIRNQGEEIRKQFNSPEWKKQMEDIRIQGEAIRKQFNSPEWKKQQKKMKKEIEKSQKEWRKSMDINRQPVIPEKPKATEPPEKF